MFVVMFMRWVEIGHDLVFWRFAKEVAPSLSPPRHEIISSDIAKIPVEVSHWTNSILITAMLIIWVFTKECPPVVIDTTHVRRRIAKRGIGTLFIAYIVQLGDGWRIFEIEHFSPK